MTTELTETTADDDRVTTALRELADGWASTSTLSPQMFASGARSAWRRKLTIIAASGTIGLAGAVTVGVSLAPSMRASLRPSTISASDSPTTPPSYAGYTVESLGVISHTNHGNFVVAGEPRLPDYLPVVDAAGLVGVTGVSGAYQSGTVTRDLDQYSGGGVTDQGFGVTLSGTRANPGVGFLSGRGPDKPLILAWSRPPEPLAVGQVLVTADKPGGIPVGTVTKLLPSVYPDKHASRAEVTPFANLDRPGQVWVLRHPGDDPTQPSAVPPKYFAAPNHLQLSSVEKLMTVGSYSFADFTSVDPSTGVSQTCLVLTSSAESQGPDCRTAAKLGRDSLAVDVGGSYTLGSNSIIIAGRAGTSVARVVIVLDDGRRIEAHVVDGGTAYVGRYFAATWPGNVPADKAIAYDADGKQIGGTVTYYGSGGDF